MVSLACTAVYGVLLPQTEILRDLTVSVTPFPEAMASAAGDNAPEHKS